jgi:predicted RNase H-like HicB family nuclease
LNEYVAIFEQADDGGWDAYIPDVPSVVALGSSRDEVEERIPEALAAYASELQSLGRSLPEPSHAAGVARG